MLQTHNGGKRDGNPNVVPVIFRAGEVALRSSMPGFVYRPEFTLHEGRFRYIMVVKMPGVTKENVNLFITNGVLTIEGATVGKIKDNFSVWKYKRELSVPNDVDVRNISAAMEDGVLTLKVYKKPVKKVITVR